VAALPHGDGGRGAVDGRGDWRAGHRGGAPAPAAAAAAADGAADPLTLRGPVGGAFSTAEAAVMRSVAARVPEVTGGRASLVITRVSGQGIMCEVGGSNLLSVSSDCARAVLRAVGAACAEARAVPATAGAGARVAYEFALVREPFVIMTMCVPHLVPAAAAGPARAPSTPAPPPPPPAGAPPPAREAGGGWLGPWLPKRRAPAAPSPTNAAPRLDMAALKLEQHFDAEDRAAALEVCSAGLALQDRGPPIELWYETGPHPDAQDAGALANTYVLCFSGFERITGAELTRLAGCNRAVARVDVHAGPTGVARVYLTRQAQLRAQASKRAWEQREAVTARAVEGGGGGDDAKRIRV